MQVGRAEVVLCNQCCVVWFCFCFIFFFFFLLSYVDYFTLTVLSETLARTCTTVLSTVAAAGPGQQPASQ